MIAKFDYKNTSIRYSDQGSGMPIVLLHGYLESLNIWDDFALELAKKYRVISLDLPGHGYSQPLGEIAHFEDIADTIKAILDYLKLNKVFIVGHSMGGYAMLSFAEQFPETVMAMCFFHSVSWNDTDEKKANRDKEIEVIKNGKRDILYSINVPKGFATDNVEKFKTELEASKEIAKQSTDEGICAALRGMKIRKNRTFIVENTISPILFMIGKKDNYIPIEKLLELSTKAKIKYVVVMENSGHMGFIEEKQLALDEFDYFIENYITVK